MDNYLDPVVQENLMANLQVLWVFRVTPSWVLGSKWSLTLNYLPPHYSNTIITRKVCFCCNCYNKQLIARWNAKWPSYFWEVWQGEKSKIVLTGIRQNLAPSGRSVASLTFTGHAQSVCGLTCAEVCSMCHFLLCSRVFMSPLVQILRHWSSTSVDIFYYIWALIDIIG